LKVLGLIVVVLAGVLLIHATEDFPEWADPESPASTHVSHHYIEKAMEETSVPNIVTAVLADYRSYDTMFETAVVFAAGAACFFLLRRPRRKKGPEEHHYRHAPTGIIMRIREGKKMPVGSREFQRIDKLWTPHDLVIKNTCRLLIPFIQLFALYVIAHGHHSPGGGFQGGVIFGASVILFAISHDLRTSTERISERTDGILISTGVLLYAATGVLCIVLGFNFLDYGALASILYVDPVTARSHGILIVEIGVGITVLATMIWIYSILSSEGRYEEGL